MTSFVGEYTAKIDDKGRIVLPSALKNAIPEGTPLRFMVKKDIYANCLEMYLYEEWEKNSSEILGSLNSLNPEHAQFWRKYMRHTAEVAPDPKLGRITIPRMLLDMIGATKEVVFSGVNFKIEIWAKEKFEAEILSDEEFVRIAQKLALGQ